MNFTAPKDGSEPERGVFVRIVEEGDCLAGGKLVAEPAELLAAVAQVVAEGFRPRFPRRGIA